MKSYQGIRTSQGCMVTVTEEGELAKPLDAQSKAWNFSLTGFEWGNSGAGAAQLALALAADVLGDSDRAKLVCNDLKVRIVKRLGNENWILSENVLRAVIESIERDRGNAR